MVLLDKIDSPQDLKKLTPSQLPQLCNELREFIITKLADNPGHLGSSLGVVELTVALHYVYDTPFDNLVWDVGHQAYAHKILTGRRDMFHTNRKLGGISGFPRRGESQYDSFSGGHSSVSISAALGMDMASDLLGVKSHSIAVIGDGAMSGGLAFEGLNNAGVLSKDILVVVNDNDMSIDPNVGALNKYLVKMTTSSKYNKFRSNVATSLSKMPTLMKLVGKTVNGLKLSLLHHGNLFEALNFRYFGVVDGHNVVELVSVLQDLKKIERPKVLHIVTKKGKGYAPAEVAQTTWHAPGIFDALTGVRATSSSPYMRFQDVFGHTLLELAESNHKIIGVTPAMPSGSSMCIMQKVLPSRVFDVGIAEGHAVTFSGGAATVGVIPFCNIYSTFLQRAYDNIIHDISLQNVDVVLCLDRSGLVGEDGSSHHGAFDIAYLSTIPHITICAPSNEHELRNLMYTASLGGCGTFAIRYPRGTGSITEWRCSFQKVTIGESVTLQKGSDIAVISVGATAIDVATAIKELGLESKLSDSKHAKQISIEHIDLRFVKPLDTVMLEDIASRFSRVITVEDGTRDFGVGGQIASYFNSHNHNVHVTKLGIPDEFIQHGTIEELKSLCGYDKDSIKSTIATLVAIV